MTTLDIPDFHVPYLRRRNTPAQLRSLNRLFDATPHPTRAQRQALANEIGLELKSVTNWFQNRRQTSRRRPNENQPPIGTRSPPRRHGRPSRALDRSKISLDRIAALAERPSSGSRAPPPPPPVVPLTPRTDRGNARRGVVVTSPSAGLWTHMPSSPVLPPSSSPDPEEEARLAALPSRAKPLYPLEWACLKARQKKWVDEDVEAVVVPLSLDGRSTHTLFPPPQFGDVEAAIALLDFKTRS